MLSFDEELRKFQPVSETGDVEEMVYNKDLTDMTDIMKQMLRDQNGDK